MNNIPYRFELGSFLCIAICDGGHMGSADFIFCNAPELDLAQTLEKHTLEADQLKSSWTCLLVDTGEKTLLVDTGVGSGVPGGGQLVELLEREGYPAENIDMVFITHGHPDHIGGCTGENGKLVFERARYLMGKTEYEFWTMEENLSNLGGMMEMFARKNLPAIRERVQFVKGDDEVLPGIQAVKAFGHTPGHLGLEIQSQGEQLLHLSDVALHPLHLEQPEWHAKVDIQPEQMVATRYDLLGRAAKIKAKVLFPHFDFPGIGYVLQAENAWHWQSIV